MSSFVQKIHKTNRPVLVADLISAMVLILMLYTSLSKIIDHETFRLVLLQSPLLHRFAGIIAFVLPVTEILTATLLFIPGLKLKGLYVSLLLLCVFTIYIIYMVVFSPELPCSCGGVLQFLTWKNHICFNLFFIVLSIQGIILYKKNERQWRGPPWLPRPRLFMRAPKPLIHFNIKNQKL